MFPLVTESDDGLSSVNYPLIQVSFDMGSWPTLPAQVAIQGVKDPFPPVATITFLVDSGADVTSISAAHWPSQWPLDPLPRAVSGVGGLVEGHRSRHPVLIRWDDAGVRREVGPLRPYVLAIPISLLGRDALVLAGARLHIEPSQQVLYKGPLGSRAPVGV